MRKKIFLVSLLLIICLSFSCIFYSCSGNVKLNENMSIEEICDSLAKAKSYTYTRSIQEDGGIVKEEYRFTEKGFSEIIYEGDVIYECHSCFIKLNKAYSLVYSCGADNADIDNPIIAAYYCKKSEVPDERYILRKDDFAKDMLYYALKDKDYEIKDNVVTFYEGEVKCVISNICSTNILIVDELKNYKKMAQKTTYGELFGE